uniref:Uncharacterized protein n=1 Tax=Pyxicephalus adspersus TaxID=30357 RepID=A0AAV2ZRN2_PYXAD|nr:TPA: hypothetical protein GDO54_004025 [Pyxicephalus adspersus]
MDSYMWYVAGHVGLDPAMWCTLLLHCSPYAIHMGHTGSVCGPCHVLMIILCGQCNPYHVHLVNTGLYTQRRPHLAYRFSVHCVDLSCTQDTYRSFMHSAVCFMYMWCI